jgi:hypothetical protein
VLVVLAAFFAWRGRAAAAVRVRPPGGGR